MTDVTAYAYSSEWTEYEYDQQWAWALVHGPWVPTTYQETVGGVYASHFIFGS